MSIERITCEFVGLPFPVTRTALPQKGFAFQQGFPLPLPYTKRNIFEKFPKKAGVQIILAKGFIPSAFSI